MLYRTAVFDQRNFVDEKNVTNLLFLQEMKVAETNKKEDEFFVNTRREVQKKYL